jgi:multidrug efflux pump
MGGMIAVVVLALLMAPVFFVVVQRVLGRDREKATEAAKPEGTNELAEASPQA